ncbi:hypothetical protein LINPERHAP1_LOCUS16604 [Linum perenne]
MALLRLLSSQANLAANSAPGFSRFYSQSSSPYLGNPNCSSFSFMIHQLHPWISELLFRLILGFLYHIDSSY